MFVCEQCGYSTKSQAYFTRHMNRKTKCVKKPEAKPQAHAEARPQLEGNTDNFMTESKVTNNDIVNNVTINRYFVFNCYSHLDNRFMMEFAASNIFNEILNLFPGNTPEDPYILTPKDLTTIIKLKYPDREQLEAIL